MKHISLFVEMKTILKFDIAMALQLSPPVLPALDMLRPHSLSRFHGSDVEVGVFDGALFWLGNQW